MTGPSLFGLNSSFRERDDLRTKEKAMFLQMNPIDAKGKGLKEGDPDGLQPARRSDLYFENNARRSFGGRGRGRGVVVGALPGQGSVNALTSQRLTDRGNGSTFYDNTVEVRQP